MTIQLTGFRMPRLSGKLCVVTGAARGIGRAISHAFLTEGVTVIMTDKDEPAGTQAAAELGCRFERLDVAEERDWLRLPNGCRKRTSSSTTPA
jgi:3(or 17)beta-hydroxysteroid dehydrogenase